MKWTNDTTHPAGKIQIGKVNKALRELENEHHTKIRLSGIVGCTEGWNAESSYVSMSYRIGGNNPLREDVTAAQQRIGEAFAWTVTAKNANAIIKAIEAALPALREARPVVDERRTQDAVSAQAAEAKAREDERERKAEAERALFVAHYGIPGAPTVPRPEDMMAVTVSLKFDNSHSQSDYFDRHATLGPAFLLALVPKGRQTEALARQWMARYPQLVAPMLEGQAWTWHTEQYSGGHGNYLDGPGVDLPEDLRGIRDIYGGGKVVRARWQIEFDSYIKDYPPFAGYPGTGRATAPAEGPTGGATTGIHATVNLNQALNGVEVHFDAKPSPEVIAELKANGFRWALRTKCWYRKQSESAIACANRIAGVAA